MRRGMWIFCAILMGCLLFLADSCVPQGKSPTATATPAPSETPSPTFTSTPPPPTVTPRPTPTNTPPPTPTREPAGLAVSAGTGSVTLPKAWLAELYNLPEAWRARGKPRYRLLVQALDPVDAGECHGYLLCYVVKMQVDVEVRLVDELSGAELASERFPGTVPACPETCTVQLGGASAPDAAFGFPKTYFVKRWLEEVVPGLALELSPVQPGEWARLDAGEWILLPKYGELARLRPGEWIRPPESGQLEDVLCVAFSPDGQTLASGTIPARPQELQVGLSEETIHLWDVGSGKLLRTLSGHGLTGVNSVAFSPDGQMLASASSDRTVKLWDLSSGQAVATLQGHSQSVWSVAFAPDGRLLASGSEDASIRLWDVASARTVRKLKGHSEGVRAVAFSPDGKTLASGSADGSVKLWDIATGQVVRTFRDPAASRDFDCWNCVAFHPSGQTLFAGANTGRISVWRIADDSAPATLVPGKRRAPKDMWPVLSLAISPDGQVLAAAATGMYLTSLQPDAREYVWTGPRPGSNSVVFSPDGTLVASAGGGGVYLGRVP